MLNSLGRNFPSPAYRGNRNGIRNERLHTPEQWDYTMIQLSELRKQAANVLAGTVFQR